MNVKCGNTIVRSGKSIKYLGLMLDQKLKFGEHAIQTAKKTADIGKKLGYILPNLGGAGQKRRKLLSCVVTSKLLYGVPCWEEHMTNIAWKKLESVYRRIAIKTVCSYKSVSHEAVLVVSSMAPLRLLAKHRSEMYAGEEKRTSGGKLITLWQKNWDRATTGRRTHRLIPNILPWIKR